METTTQEFLTVEQLAQKLHYSADRVRQLARSGRLPGIKRGRSWLFDFDDVKTQYLNINSKSKSVGEMANAEESPIE